MVTKLGSIAVLISLAAMAPACSDGLARTNSSDTMLVSIEVTPANPDILNDQTQVFTATGTFSDGTKQNLTTWVKWYSSSPSVATFSNAVGTEGVAMAVDVGSTKITATLGDIAGTTTCSVITPISTVLR